MKRNRNRITINKITINIQNWKHVSNQEIMRIVRKVINNASRDEAYKEPSNCYYWNDYDKTGMELQIIFQ